MSLTNEKFDSDEEYYSYLRNQALTEEELTVIKNSLFQTEKFPDYLISKLDNLENIYKNKSWFSFPAVKENEKED